MVAVCPNFKCLGFQISDPIQDLNNLQTNLVRLLKIQTSPDFSPTFNSLEGWHYLCVQQKKVVYGNDCLGVAQDYSNR